MNPLEKSIRRYISFKVLVVTAVFVVSLLFSAFVCKGFDVGDGKHAAYAEISKSYKSTVVQLLKQREFELKKQEESNDDMKSNKNGIYIEKAIPVVLQYDGKEERVMTARTRVKNLLSDNNLRLDGMDKLCGIQKNDLLYADMRVKIVRIRGIKEIREENIAFKIRNVNNPNLEVGKSIVKAKGESGKKQSEFEVTCEDGKEKSRKLVKETIIKKPVEQVVEIGTKSEALISNGVNLNYKRVLDMRATAYTASYNDTGKSPGEAGFGITYTGVRVKKGIIAVDPSVIPLGSRVYIKGLGGVSSYGYALAADIGGAIKGNKIDLYFEDSTAANNWGCQNVKVYLLN